jgi:Isochorismatase family
LLSTVNVAANGQPPTIPALREVLSESVEIDRTQINSWEDVDFRKAVEATGRKKLVMTALWTEGCLAFPALDALREGYEVFPVVDAVGGTSPEAHRAGLERIVQAGAQPISWVSLACELQRDWARRPTPFPKWWTSCSLLGSKKGSEQCADRSWFLPGLAVQALAAGKWRP